MYMGPLKPTLLVEDMIRQYFVFKHGTELMGDMIEDDDDATYVEINEGDVCIRIEYKKPKGSQFAGVIIRDGAPEYARAYHIEQALSALLISNVKLHPDIRQDAQTIVDYATMTPPPDWLP